MDTTGNSTGVEPLCGLWLLRLLVPLGAGKIFSVSRANMNLEMAKIFPMHSQNYSIPKMSGPKNQTAELIRKKRLMVCITYLYPKKKNPEKPKRPTVGQKR